MASKRPHPGKVLKSLFLDEMGISQSALATAIGVPRSRISDICNGKRRIEPDTAIRLGYFFDNSPQFWLNLQNQYEVRQLEHARNYSHIVRASAVLGVHLQA